MTDQQVSPMKERYPASEYKEMQFNFTKGEWMRMVAMDTLVQQGRLAEVLINNTMNGEVLKRIGIKNSPDVGIEYNASEGLFTVWIPKQLCSVCKKSKATHSYEGQGACETCLPLLQIKKEVAK